MLSRITLLLTLVLPRAALRLENEKSSSKSSSDASHVRPAKNTPSFDCEDPHPRLGCGGSHGVGDWNRPGMGQDEFIENGPEVPTGSYKAPDLGKRPVYSNPDGGQKEKPFEGKEDAHTQYYATYDEQGLKGAFLKDTGRTQVEKADKEHSIQDRWEGKWQPAAREGLQNLVRDAVSPVEKRPERMNYLKDPTSCVLPQNSGVAGCTCKVEDFYACKTQGPECRDEHGICDPAATPTGRMIQGLTSAMSKIAWYAKKTTCETIKNPYNGQRECRGAFLANYALENPDGTRRKCICYEASITAPARWSYKHGWQNYTKNMLDGHKGGGPLKDLYNKSQILFQSCAQMGFRWDKKVHPCWRHAYVTFRDQECQNEFRVYRQAYLESTNSKKREWNEKFGKGTLLYSSMEESMMGGGCNNGL